MHRAPRSILALAALLTSCRGEPSSRSEASQAAPPPAPSASASASVPVRVFATAPIFLHDLVVTVGRAGAPHDLDVRGKVDVVPRGEGRVEIPTKIACRYGDRQVVAFTKMINATSDRFSLERHGTADTFARAPTNVGTIGKPDACELTFHLDPIGIANQSVRDMEETVCWRGAITAGGCAFAPPTPPSAQFELHDLSAVVSAERIEVRGHLKTRDKDPQRTSISCDATCADEPPTGEFVALPATQPFSLAAGESRPFQLEVARAGERSANQCTLELSWRPWNDEVAEAAVNLGKWCATSDGVTAGACPRAP